MLCSKLRTFAYEELEFFLPQYVSLGRRAPLPLGTVDTSLPIRRHAGYVTSSSA